MNELLDAALSFCHLLTREEMASALSADILFFASYIVIPLAVVVGYVRVRRHIQWTFFAGFVALSSAAFIVACGLYHIARVFSYSPLEYWWMLGLSPSAFYVAVAEIGARISGFVALLYLYIFTYHLPRIFDPPGGERHAPIDNSPSKDIKA